MPFNHKKSQVYILVLLGGKQKDSSEATHMAIWSKADWVGDGVDAEILPSGSIKSLKGRKRKGRRVRGSATLSLK